MEYDYSSQDTMRTDLSPIEEVSDYYEASKLNYTKDGSVKDHKEVQL